MTDQPTTETKPTIRVQIDTHGPTITIDAAEDLETVATKALELFREALALCPPRDINDGPKGMGFTTDRRETPPVQPSSMAWAPGPYPVQAGQQ